MTRTNGANGAGEAMDAAMDAATLNGHDTNGAASAADTAAQPPAGPDPAVLKKVASLRAHVRESFGQIAMAMMLLPRYRHQTLGDLQHLILEPLIRDRIAIAYPGNREQDPLADTLGVAIWASVSEEADGRIREQIKAGSFPIRLKPEDWNSGPHRWLLDVIAPDARTTANVIANFKQVVKEGALKLHPIITTLVDGETLKKMGAERLGREMRDAEGDAAIDRPSSES